MRTLHGRLDVAQGADGGTTVQKVASTLIVRHVGFLRRLGVVHDTSTAGP